jgi:hypothetical protein
MVSIEESIRKNCTSSGLVQNDETWQTLRKNQFSPRLPSSLAPIRAQAKKRHRPEPKTSFSPYAPAHLSQRLAPLHASSYAATLVVNGVALTTPSIRALIPVANEREAVEYKPWRHILSTSIVPLS